MVAINEILKQVGKIAVKGVLDNLLKTFIIAFALAILGCYIIEETWLRIVFLCFVAAILLVVLHLYIYFAKNNPQFLRSEELQLKQEIIKMLGSNKELRATAQDIIKIVYTKSKQPKNPLK